MLMVVVVGKFGVSREDILLPNVPDDLSLLASGIQACSAGDMPEVPKA